MRSSRQFFGIALAVTSFAVSVVGAANLVPVSATGSITPGTAAQVAALVSASTSINTADAAVLNQLHALLGDNWGNQFGILQNTSCLTATDCVFGDLSGSKTVVLYGDSHAREWLPAINPNAVQDHLKLVLLGKDGCPVADLNLTAHKFAGCNAVRTTAESAILAMRPKVVILGDQTSGTGISFTAWKNGMVSTIKNLKHSGATIILLQDLQEFNISPGVCISIHALTIQANCSIKNPNPSNILREPAEASAAKATLITYLKENQWFCTPTRCSPVIGDFLSHFDVGHITASYATYLSAVMGSSLNKAFTS